jgi:hypothetical protein
MRNLTEMFYARAKRGRFHTAKTHSGLQVQELRCAGTVVQARQHDDGDGRMAITILINVVPLWLAFANAFDLAASHITSERLRPGACCPSTQTSWQHQANSSVNMGKYRPERSKPEGPDRLRHLHFPRQPTVLPIRQRAFQQNFAEMAVHQKLRQVHSIKLSLAR